MPGAFGTARRDRAEGGGRRPSRAPTASTSSPPSPRAEPYTVGDGPRRGRRLRLRHQAHDPAPPRRASPPSRSCRRRRRAADVLAREPDGVFLSNGPGDPATVPYAVDAIRGLLGEVPVFGICLGHQLLCARARRARRTSCPFGHHGGNHPVRRLATGAVEITSQNHNFAVAADSLRRRRRGDPRQPQRRRDRGPARARRAGVQRAVPPRGRARARTTPRYLFDEFDDADGRRAASALRRARRPRVDPPHRLRPDRHRPGVRVRLLGHAGLPGAARGGLPRRSSPTRTRPRS